MPQPSGEAVLGAGYHLSPPRGGSDVTAAAKARTGTSYDFVFNRGKRVVYVSHGAATGGAEAFFEQADERLRRAGAREVQTSAPITLDGEAQTVSLSFELNEGNGEKTRH